jgi:hypothetical protein
MRANRAILEVRHLSGFQTGRSKVFQSGITSGDVYFPCKLKAIEIPPKKFEVKTDGKGRASDRREGPRGFDARLRGGSLRIAGFTKPLTNNRKSSSGIASNTSPPTSTVRHADSPETELQRLLPVLAPSHSSIGLPAIQMRLDSEGLAWNASSSISLVSRIGSIPRGFRVFFNLRMALCISFCVVPQRPHVSPVRNEPLPDYW